jgi:hypothetical protein
VLPQDAMLLALASANESSVVRKLNRETRKRLRLLFQSKLIESQISSYEVSSYDEVSSKPKKKPWKHFERMPVKSGGPIVICIDTSWSMAGHRERLAKAVVLECSSLAAKQYRNIYVLAFSGSNDLKECELDLTVTRKGIVNLLNFLRQSFRGGTDVTGPLVRAMELVESSAEWASADFLLVTDGELQMPPVPQAVIEKLRRFERDSLEVHGLLVGKKTSPPLSLLCTDWDGKCRLHTFLDKYDLANVLRQAGSIDQNPIGKVISSGNLGMRKSTKLYAHPSTAEFPESPPFRTSDELEALFSKANDRVDGTKKNLRESSNKILSSSSTERKEKLQSLVESLGSGLIERDEETRLVLLATLCREHLLLLGPPGNFNINLHDLSYSSFFKFTGTGKTELGRRLAAISNGKLFERLLTKYTSPEELFGPLSLMQLENDKYVRVTKGYLPDAQIAFLDEIFKANSAILNSLLTILNERKFDNGENRVDIPLMTVVGASNELPDNEELEALYDRFLFRKSVNPVSDGAVLQLLSLSRRHIGLHDEDKTLENENHLSPALITTCLEDALRVKIPSYVQNILRDCRSVINTYFISPVINEINR